MYDEDQKGGAGEGPWRRRATAARSPFAGPVFSAPPVVMLTIVVLAAVYAVIALAPPATGERLIERLAVDPARLLAGPKSVGGIFPWLAPLFTHMLAHASLAHFLFNALWLLAFGAPVARRLRSASRFLGLFFLTGAAGAVAFSYFHSSEATLLIGASGGVSGLLGGLARFAFGRPAHFAPDPQPLLKITDPTVIAWSAAIILLNLGVAVFGPGFGAERDDIAWEAHIGGYLFGLATMPMFDRRPIASG